jgi:hypothetical protein
VPNGSELEATPKILKSSVSDCLLMIVKQRIATVITENSIL